MYGYVGLRRAMYGYVGLCSAMWGDVEQCRAMQYNATNRRTIIILTNVEPLDAHATHLPI